VVLEDRIANLLGQVILDLLVAMGCGGKVAARVTQKSSDERIDGVINEDRFGF